MIKDEYCLTPIKKDLPQPPHTKVKVRCFTCKHFPVCNIRLDYLRTAKLIENILGAPSDNYEFKKYPGFCGKDILFGKDYMPKEIVTTANNIGFFEGIKYCDKDKYNFIYDVNNYKVLFSAQYEDDVAIDNSFIENMIFSIIKDDLAQYTYPPVTKPNENNTQYHYKPISISISDAMISKILNNINDSEDGEITIDIHCIFNGVFGNFNYLERYPTEDEIKDDSSLILTGITSGIIELPIIKKENKIFINEREKISLKINPTTDTLQWNEMFKSENIQLDLTTGQKLIDLLTQSSTTKTFQISEGRDICYKTPSKLSIDSEKMIIVALTEIREELLKKKCETVINTTAFSAQLDCKFYEWEKGLDYNEGIKKIIAQYPNGIPIGPCGELYHLATYHIEDGCVPCYHPDNNQPVFMPMPYPVFIPKHCKKKPPHTRDELNEI